jgi:hypothetical protein
VRIPGRLLVFLATVVTVGATAGAATAGNVVNGGFETGTLSGWSTADNDVSFGAWFIQSGNTSPLNGFPVSPPPEGFFQAMTDQFGPGAHVLFQNVGFSPGDSLSFWVDYENQAGLFCTPATLDPFAPCNQQFRVDLMTPSSDPFSVDPADVIQNVFQTQVGDPVSLAPTLVTTTTFHTCTLVRIRVAEVDNQLFFNAGVDGFVVHRAFPIRPPQIPCRI